jgi:toxin ParE1/3/4
MSHDIRRRRNVRQDLADLFVDLGRTRVSSAHRFLREAEATFQRLARSPGIGARYEPDDPLFEGVRFFPVSRFKKDLVFFYRSLESGIEILRILHGARDIQGLLAEGFDPPGDDEDDAAAEEPDAP